MTTLVLVGRLTDALGHAEYRSTSWDGRAATEIRTFEALPASEYRSRQEQPIPVRRAHDGRDHGRVVYLERQRDGGITAIAQVTGCDDLLVPRNGPHFWSPGLRFRAVDGTDVQITELVATTDPASMGLAPLDVVPGDVHQAADFVRCRHRPKLAELLDRAADAEQRRPRGGPIVIEDPTAQKWEEVPDGGWVDGRGSFIPGVHRSESGQYRWINGNYVEIEHTAPYHGGVISVR